MCQPPFLTLTVRNGPDLREPCKYTAKLGTMVGVPALVAEFIG